eukprot:1048196-Pelagomonas_calceolata.AAC.15
MLSLRLAQAGRSSVECNHGRGGTHARLDWQPPQQRHHRPAQSKHAIITVCSCSCSKGNRTFHSATACVLLAWLAAGLGAAAARSGCAGHAARGAALCGGGARICAPGPARAAHRCACACGPCGHAVARMQLVCVCVFLRLLKPMCALSLCASVCHVYAWHTPGAGKSSAPS